VISLLVGSPSLSFSGQFKVTRVHDGETIRAEGHGIEIVVRLAGIEVSETPKDKDQVDSYLAPKAKSYLAEMTLNKLVEIEWHGMDEMNRVIGVVYLAGMNVNLKMVKAGYARVYRGDPPHPLYLLPYLKAQQSAKRAGRGIWSNDKGLVNSRHFAP
jgi:micrococcal nuclease